MISLETIQVAKPCRADWDAMTGDAQVRHCGSCRQNVYNLSEMTRAQAEAVILEHEGHLCVRCYTRADGTVLTQDCPVGLRAFRLKAAKKLSWAAALALACVTGLWRGETAHAVTHQAAKSSAKSPPAPTQPRVLPMVTAGMPMWIPPPPTQPHPKAAQKHVGKHAAKPHTTPPPALMGKPILPPHGWTMGAPPPAPAPHKTAKKK